ncbi:hypothetical protein ACP8HI_07155 [Paenibacillus sp. FA6]|uniref:hypothetical protein n=1 Tax=Paenibacillus sp. FA6 TaxID=3413029 RepID=UPI003F658921
MNTRIRLKENTYLIPSKPPSTLKVLHPQIKVDGNWCYIKDESTQTKLAEANDEIHAYKQAVVALRKVDKGREEEKHDQENNKTFQTI